MKTKTPVSDQLVELREQAVRIRDQAREAQLAHQRAVEDVERLREARVRALTAEDEETAARFQTERDEAERTAVNLADRLEAALRAVQGAEGEHGAYAAQNTCQGYWPSEERPQRQRPKTSRTPSAS